MNSREQEMHLMQRKIMRDQLVNTKEIEKTLSINLDTLDNTLEETNIHLKEIAIATKKIAQSLRKWRNE